MKKQEMVLFIYGGLATVGGIETYIYKMMKQLQAGGVKVGLLKKKNTGIADCFREELLGGNVFVLEKISPEKIRNYAEKNNIKSLKIIAFSVFDFATAEKLRRALSDYKVDSFYFVPHYCGAAYYPEEAFHGAKAESVRNKMATIFQKTYENGSLLYFSDKHIASVKSAYGVGDSDAEDFMVPRTIDVEKLLDEEDLKAIYNRNEFKILAVSRIEFPHKGFFYGLLQTYIRMKPKYPQLTLTIVGDGPNLNDLKQLLADVDEAIVKDVTFTGAVAPDKLNDYYCDANLLIAVAGSLTIGAKQGTLCIPARHYSYDCEVYGFMPEAAPFVISEEKGMDVEPFIEQAMCLSFDEYVDRCKRTAAFYQEEEKQIKTIFEIKNLTENPVLSLKDIKYIKHLEQSICGLPARAYKLLKREGLVQAIIRKIKR